MIKRIDSNNGMSRAVVHNGLIYFGGHAAAGKQPTIQEQTKALLARYDELLEMNGSDKNHLIFANIYISDMALKPGMNEIWNTWIEPGNGPARVTVEAGLDEGYLIEISIIAALNS